MAETSCTVRKHLHRREDISYRDREGSFAGGAGLYLFR